MTKTPFMKRLQPAPFKLELVADDHPDQKSKEASTTMAEKTPIITKPQACKWLLVIACLQILLHLPMITEPPQGQHVWRKIVGHAAAMNYLEEDNRFFWPRADIRTYAGDTGAIYHELPVTYWLTAQAYRAFGVWYGFPHIVALAFNLLLIWGGYRLGRGLLYDRQQSLLLAFFMALSPLAIYYADTFVPNALGLSLFVAGMGMWLPAIRKGRFSGSWLAGLILVAMATTAKQSYLFFGLPIAYIFAASLRQHRWHPRVWALAAASGAFILGSQAWIYRHAKALYEASPLDRAIHTPFGPSESPESLKVVLDNLNAAVFKWFMEMNVGHAAWLFFVVGAVTLWQQRQQISSLTKGFWGFWGASFAIFASVFVVRLADHDYYIMSSLPLAAALSARGAQRLLQAPRWRLVALVFIVLFPLVSANRIKGRWFEYKQVPVEFLAGDGPTISAPIPKDDLILIQGDTTPVVFLYYLQRKGLSLDTRKSKLADLGLENFSWLVHYKPRGPIAATIKANARLELVKDTGDFAVYKLLPMVAKAENPAGTLDFHPDNN